MTRFELAIAWRYVRSRRDSKLVSLVSLLSILGVTVAVSALVVTVGVMNGLRDDLRDKILTGAPDVYVITYDQDMVMTNWRDALRTIQHQRGVAAAAPFVITQALVRAASPGSRALKPVYVKGLPPAGPGVANVTSIRQHATAGDFSFLTRDGSHRGAVVGVRLADEFHLRPRVDSITLAAINPNRIDSVTGYPVPHLATLPVTGVFDTGLYEYDAAYVFVSLDVARELAGVGDAVSGIEVKTPTRDAAPAVSAALQDTLGVQFVARDWQDQNGGLFAALRLEKLGMFVSLLLISIVAAFNIIGTLTMVVTDRAKEIGILRAMGTSARSIRLVFFAQGMVIGLIGTAAGLALGLPLAMLIGRAKLIALDPKIYFIDHLPVATQPLDVSIIVLVSLGIAALATVYPAQRAARLAPIDAIRHE